MTPKSFAPVAVMLQAVRAFIDNGLLVRVTDQHGDTELRCTVCKQVDGHRPSCTVYQRLLVIASAATKAAMVLLLLSTVACGSPTAPTVTQKTTTFDVLAVRVLDFDTYAPLSDALVCGDKACLATNDTGYAFLPAPAKAAYTIFVTKPGYHDGRYQRGAYAWEFYLVKDVP